MLDIVEKIGKASTVQHGQLNNRIYLMKLDQTDAEDIVSLLNALALKNQYAKIFCKVPKNLSPLFTADGYRTEAYIPRFYNGVQDLFFMSKFTQPNRLQNIETEQLSILSKLLSTEPKPKNSQLEQKAAQYNIRKLGTEDVDKITEIYREVFESYPFPIHDPNYILKTMDEDVQYYGAEKAGELAALASSEMDVKGANAEMTDFATHPHHYGNNLSTLLLDQMEEAMKIQGIKTLYTIARLNSIAMNKTFIRNDYQYTGTLIKNTNIAGKIESMNVYFKHI